MTQTMRIGLHLTKCAGTSLVTTVREHLAEDLYCFESSYYENFCATRPLFSELRDYDRLRIYFGHFANESHIGMFAERPLFLFTGVRSPIARAVSAYRHLNALRLRAGGKPQQPEAFLQDQQGHMCNEIVRAFPTLAARHAERRSAALAALSLMDFIYSTENFAEDAKTLLGMLRIDAAPPVENSADQRGETREESELTARCRDLLTHEPERWLGDDIAVYAAIQPYLSTLGMRTKVSHEAWSVDRDRFIAGLPDRATCRARLTELERGYLLYEFQLLGRLDALDRALRREIRVREGLLERLSTFRS